ncbi:MAG: hypothetical protein K2Q45_08990 [Nitrosomonas sp.]|nr:hypothetical protein [Nitrosomonas sp.]
MVLYPLQKKPKRNQFCSGVREKKKKAKEKGFADLLMEDMDLTELAQQTFMGLKWVVWAGFCVDENGDQCVAVQVSTSLILGQDEVANAHSGNMYLSKYPLYRFLHHGQLKKGKWLPVPRQDRTWWSENQHELTPMFERFSQLFGMFLARIAGEEQESSTTVMILIVRSSNYFLVSEGPYPENLGPWRVVLREGLCKPVGNAHPSAVSPWAFPGFVGASIGPKSAKKDSTSGTLGGVLVENATNKKFALTAGHCAVEVKGYSEPFQNYVVPSPKDVNVAVHWGKYELVAESWSNNEKSAKVGNLKVNVDAVLLESKSSEIFSCTIKDRETECFWQSDRVVPFHETNFLQEPLAFFGRSSGPKLDIYVHNSFTGHFRDVSKKHFKDVTHSDEPFFTTKTRENHFILTDKSSKGPFVEGDSGSVLWKVCHDNALEPVALNVAAIFDDESDKPVLGIATPIEAVLTFFKERGLDVKFCVGKNDVPRMRAAYDKVKSDDSA